jgi:hypothetical protein
MYILLVYFSSLFSNTTVSHFEEYFPTCGTRIVCMTCLFFVGIEHLTSKSKINLQSEINSRQGQVNFRVNPKQK